MLMFTIVYLYPKAILHYESITVWLEEIFFKNVQSRVHHNVVKMSYTLVFSRALHIAIFFTIVVSSLKEKFTVLK